jgi:hypothetical protein
MIKSKCCNTEGPNKLSSTNKQDVLVEAEHLAELGHGGRRAPAVRAARAELLQRGARRHEEQDAVAFALVGLLLGGPNGGFGGYQNVIRQANGRGPWTYGAATEMRKDGIALAY